MVREIIILFFALGAVPLAIFLWDIFKGLLSGRWRDVMDGIITSWDGAVVAVIVVVITLLLLRRSDKRDNKIAERRHSELLNAFKELGKELTNEIRRDRDERNKPKQ